jgi:hypothetical protein
MNNNYIIYKNGFKVTTLENTSDENAIAYAEKYATQNQNDWVYVVKIATPKIEIYNRCLSFQEDY